ncbi:MAG: zinc ABC transporter substrate-binding protein [Candidatus Magasanikbacteria bacterium]|nr:zinc ABC transporter substrate-binding protein [Candidatus Magasanikbacteria bacterium]
MKSKYLLLTLALLGTMAAIFTMSALRPPVVTTPGKPTIVTTFYPLADIAQNVSRKHMEVINITPAGVEPHDFEPTPQDLAKIYRAKLFILNGGDIDAWAEKIIPELKAKNITVINMSEHLEKIQDTNAESEPKLYDPHFWLDPINVSTETDVIAETLVQIDNARAVDYNNNRAAFKKQLQQLDTDYRTGLAACDSKEIITAHNAFGYLTKRYNLTNFYILGLSPDEEPSPQKIAEIASMAKQKNIKYIFFETIIDQKLSRTIADEIGAQTLVLNPIEGLTDEELRAGKNYIQVMKDNLQNLKTALVCP